jgi:hypothetical protein
VHAAINPGHCGFGIPPDSLRGPAEIATVWRRLTILQVILHENVVHFKNGIHYFKHEDNTLIEKERHGEQKRRRRKRAH